jgi:hypothetical protein
MAKKDLNQLAKFITDIASGESEDTNLDKKINVKGRSGGLVGGNARANSLSAEKRKEIAIFAANQRWKKPKSED